MYSLERGDGLEADHSMCGKIKHFPGSGIPSLAGCSGFYLEGSQSRKRDGVFRVVQLDNFVLERRKQNGHILLRVKRHGD